MACHILGKGIDLVAWPFVGFSAYALAFSLFFHLFFVYFLGEIGYPFLFSYFLFIFLFFGFCFCFWCWLCLIVLLSAQLLVVS